MRTLHFDCFAGISGDMALGAFVDLEVDANRLVEELRKLGIGGWDLSFRREDRCGIGGTRAIVTLPHHHHDHDHDHYHGGHSHTTWREIRTLIEGSTLEDPVKTRALDIFSRIAVAESQVHGVPVEDVGFHEVGAVDSIIDIVGVAVCLDILKPDRITASEIELGGGTVTCAHGILPVPAPATLILCAGLPVKTGGFQKEMTTPTGAAILASCVDEFVGTASFREIKSAYGVGSRKLDKPNVLRVSWREEDTLSGTPASDPPWREEKLILMEANIDDMSGEALGFLMERFFEAGALDVTLAPCVMKKTRPGTVVSVLCSSANLDTIRRVFFTQSTTLGFRETPVRRLSLERQEGEVTGDFGSARAKTAMMDGRPLRRKVEYEDRARLARERGLSLDEAERVMREEGSR
jgi:pyridinium-3,5-bisthiocarboxylic acid mononucleotide nickel chelatase